MSLNDQLRRAASGDDWPELLPLVPEVEPAPFPIDDAFPPGLRGVRSFVEGIAGANQVPVDMPAMMLLPVLSVAVAQKFVAEPRPGWQEPAALWTCTLARSGERKSATFAAMLRPLFLWQAAKAEELRPEILRQRTERAISERRLAKLEAEASLDGAEADKVRAEAVSLAQAMAGESVLHAPDLVASETTSEALAAMMAQNDERALVAAPEADALDVLLGRYSNGPNLGIWLAGHAGDPVTVKRRGREPDTLCRPALSVGLCIQPSAVEELLASRYARGRGFIARLLFSAPASMLGRRELDPDPVPERLSEVYATTLRKLLDIDVPDEPIIVRLDAEASELFRDLRARIEIDLGLGSAQANDIAWLSKLPGTILRVALALHVAQVVDFPGAAGDIMADTMRAALAWEPYLRAHEASVGAVVNRDPVVVVATRLARWFAAERVREFSRRDAHRAARGAHVERVEDIDPVLDLLLDRGYLREKPATSEGKAGRRPSPRYLVNPRVGGRNGHNGQNSPSPGRSVRTVQSVRPVSDAGGLDGI